MTEQQDSPITSSDPDVEGHVIHQAAEVEDTEGHVFAAATQDDDDVEGHKMKLDRVQPQYDEDDVEGHKVL
jgi:hypothetical protein